MTDRATASEHRLKAAGKRITPQRKLVLRILAEAGGHLDATEIFHQGHLEDTSLSLSTVYRTLSVLKETEVVRELHLDDEHHHYELAGEDEHSHLVCLKCGGVIEVDGETLIQLATTLGAPYGFEISSVQLELSGYCAGCRQET